MKQRNNEKKDYQLRNTFEPPIFPNSSPCFSSIRMAKTLHSEFYKRSISTAKKDAVVCTTESINAELKLQQLEHMIEDENHQELRYTG